MYFENVVFRIQKIKFRDIFFSFFVRSRLTLSPIRIFVALFTYPEEIVA